MQLVYKFGQMYDELPPAIYYTEAEQVYTQIFFHPSTQKLLRLIVRDAKEKVTMESHGQLDHIQDTLDTSQRLAKEHRRFRVAMPHETCVFNRLEHNEA